MKERLQKIIAAAGICSRRAAEDLLRQGRVQVNGQIAALGDRADPETDAVTLDGQPLSREPERVYLMLNKPRGYVTTLSDERGRRTAAELVSGCGARVYPVGRLDMDSEGLLLMTNDGAWMQRLLHPSCEIEKEYRVTVTGPVEGAAGRLAAIRDLEGERIRPARVRELWRDGNKAALSVTIHEGKNRQIRRMCRQAGLAVRRLQRVQAIRGRMESFSRGQKRIADYILMNYDKAAFMTAGHLGRKAQVSESTVVRFASQLGYDGYPNMQRALQELVRGRLTSLQRIQVSRDQMQEQDVLTGVMQRDMNSIHTAIEQLDRAAFDRVVDRLLTASHIYLMGVRSSAFLAGYLNFYLHLMFKNVTLVQNAAAGEIFEQLSQIGPGDVLVGISFPRYSQMAIHAVEYARDRGADVVAITDSQMSPLYRMATVSLLVRSDMISFVDSMAAPLSLLNALIVAVGRQKNEEVSGTFSQLENVWSKYNIFGKTEDES